MNEYLVDPSSNLELQEERIQARKDYLKLLAQKAAGMQIQVPHGQMVGRWYVPPSWGEQLSAAATPAINSIAQGYEQSQLDKDRAEYKKQDEQARKAWIASKPQVTNIDLSGPTESGEPLTGQVAPTQQDNLNWIDQGRGIPSLRGTVTKAFEDQLIDEPTRAEARQWKSKEYELLRDFKKSEGEAARDARTHEAQLARDARAHENFQNRAARHDEAEANRDLRKTIADQVNALGKDKAQKPEKTTESERSSAGYLSRMQAAEGLIQQIGETGNIDWMSHGAGKVPIIGDDLQNVALSPKQQQMLQAQRDWVRAKLRKESGASIGDMEMSNEIRTYFPMPGDDGSVVKQKAQARKEAEQQLRISGGGAVQSERTYTSAEAMELAPGTRFKGTDGNYYVR